jgi:hypothetical protein
MSNQPQDQPQPQPPPVTCQHVPYVYQPPTPYNTYAILSLVLAVVVLPPLGIYFGNLAKKQITETGERGIELADAAVVVGWVMSILMLAFLTLWCLVFGSMMAGFFSFFGGWASVARR